MENIEQKRKFFLEAFRKQSEKISLFEKYSGPGIKKKIQRLIFCPPVYVVYIFWRLGLYPQKNVTTRLFFGKLIKSDINDYDIFVWHIFGKLAGLGEDKLTKFFVKNLKEDDIFYDIGANYGFYTYLALEFCKEVHSFEPLPDIFENLKINLENNSKAFLNNLAVADRVGDTFMYLPDSTSKGSSTIVEENLNVHHYSFKVGKKIRIKTITLNEYLNTHHKPTILKIDAEGAESMIIDGGFDFFKNSLPTIAMEVWSKDEGGHISMRAVNKLKELGYQSYFINNDGDLEKIDGELSDNVKQNNLYADNYIFNK